MTDRHTAAALLAGLMLMTGGASCSSHDNDDTAAVPRQKAYARINTYPETYRLIDSLPYTIMANAGARVTAVPTGNPQTRAWDIAYPRYRATIHLTERRLPAPDPAAMAALIDSRLQRMSLNTGTAPINTYNSTGASGLSTLMVTTLSATPTPVQILATDSASYLLTAGAYIEFEPSVGATDSLMPVINSLKADMQALLTHLDKP